MRFLTGLAVLIAAVVGQAARVDAPWLTVYDSAGQPRWEIQLEHLARTEQGWRGEDATIRLYHQGVEQATATTGLLHTGPLGRTWELSEGLEVVWEGFVIVCERGRWDDELVLWDVTATAEGLIVRCEEGRWRPGRPVELGRGEFETDGWAGTFAAGSYSITEGILTARDVRLSGHGMDMLGEEISAHLHDNVFTLKNARLKARP